MNLALWKNAKNEDESLVDIFEFVLSNPESPYKGYELFKIFKRLSYKFDKAKIDKKLELEEDEYKVLKSSIISGVPATWAFINEVSSEVEEFMNLAEEL